MIVQPASVLFGAADALATARSAARTVAAYRSIVLAQ
jgi:hypothetical protein